MPGSSSSPGSSLADVSLLGDAVVDLTAAHPSGVAQLFAGRPTRLSNLFREGGSLPAARRRARAVVVRAAEHAQRYGVAPTYLAIGVATWTQSPTAPLAEDDVAALARVAGRAPTVVPGDGDASAPTDPEPGGGTRRRGHPARAPRRPVRRRGGPRGGARAPDGARARPAAPLTVTPRGDGETDYELTLEPTAEINPLLARTLRAHGALLDP